jgi:taurine dioxygenase
VHDSNGDQGAQGHTRVGAEIEGVGLGAMDDDDLRLVHDALIEHGVVFFRDQDISVESQVALGAWFGELDVHPNDPGLEGHPEVMIIHADESSKRVAGETWHSDVSCDPEPPMGSILRIHTLPETGGDTLFASMYAAYEALSPVMQTFLRGLTAIHDGAPYYRSVNARIGRDDGGRDYPRAEHPVIRTHPESGREGLFVNEMFTTEIVGLEKAESDALLRFRSNTSGDRSSSCGSGGAEIRSRSGTIAAFNTKRSGTTGRGRGPDTG